MKKFLGYTLVYTSVVLFFCSSVNAYTVTDTLYGRGDGESSMSDISLDLGNGTLIPEEDFLKYKNYIISNDNSEDRSYNILGNYDIFYKINYIVTLYRPNIKIDDIYVIFGNTVDLTDNISIFGSGNIRISVSEENGKKIYKFKFPEGFKGITLETNSDTTLYNIELTNKNELIIIKEINKTYLISGIQKVKFFIPMFSKENEYYMSKNQMEINGQEIGIKSKNIVIGKNTILPLDSENFFYSSTGPLAETEFQENPFSDINDSFAKQYILNLYNKGIIKGYGDLTFRPNNSVTRGEFLSMIMKKSQIDISNYTNSFTDISGWVVPYAETARKLGFIQSSSHFRPNDSITRAEAIKILLNVSGKTINNYTSSSYKDIDGWKVNFIETAKELGIINSSEYFRSNDSITRAEASKIIDLLNN